MMTRWRIEGIVTGLGGVFAAATTFFTWIAVRFDLRTRPRVYVFDGVRLVQGKVTLALAALLIAGGVAAAVGRRLPRWAVGVVVAAGLGIAVMGAYALTEAAEDYVDEVARGPNFGVSREADPLGTLRIAPLVGSIAGVAGAAAAALAARRPSSRAPSDEAGQFSPLVRHGPDEG